MSEDTEKNKSDPGGEEPRGLQHHDKKGICVHHVPPLAPRAWSVTAVRGKVTDKCLWTVCKAITIGVFLIAIGAGMATLGYYSDFLSTVEQKRGNVTVLVKNESRDSHLNSLTYLGPIVMGVGGFIIVAACVMTFEARDTAAKIVPVWFRKTRIHAVHDSSSSGRSSQTSWERFLAKPRGSKRRTTTEEVEEKLLARSSMKNELLNFSKFLQTSMDCGHLNPNPNNARTLQKCPSEPSFQLPLPPNPIHPIPAAIEALKAERQKQLRDSPVAKDVKARPLTAVPHLYRQAVSVDYSPFLAQKEENGSAHPLDNLRGPTGHDSTPRLLPRPVLEKLDTERSDSRGSMAMDLYLPQGSVTLKVHDEARVMVTSSRSVSRESSKEDQKSILRRSMDSAGSSSSIGNEKVPSMTAPSQPITRHPPATRQSSTMKRHPLLRQTAMDPTCSNE